MAAFSVGALLPLLAILLPPASLRLLVTVLAVTAALVLTGVVSSRLGGAPARPADPPQRGRGAGRDGDHVPGRLAVRRLRHRRGGVAFPPGVGEASGMDADVIVVGAGLAGLVATAELVDAGRTVVLVDQEGEQGLGGQAFWSFGGLFLVDSPEQRRMGIKDSVELAWQDWQGSAQFDRARGPLAARVGRGLRPLRRRREARLPPGARPQGRSRSSGGPSAAAAWPAATATPCRASTSPGAPAPGSSSPSSGSCGAASSSAWCTFAFRHQVDELVVHDGAVTGVRGTVLAPDDAPRAASTSREAVGDVRAHRPGRLVTSGGIGGNHDLVRASWPERLGTPPEHMISGVPAHVDGRMLGIAETAGASHINRDRMWHYVEGIKNWDPIWPLHGIRILPGPSSLWLDGCRHPAAAARAARLRHARHAEAAAGQRPRPLLVRADPGDHREGVRALRARSRTPT